VGEGGDLAPRQISEKIERRHSDSKINSRKRLWRGLYAFLI
jgi:hypothetical protein